MIFQKPTTLLEKNGRTLLTVKVISDGRVARALWHANQLGEELTTTLESDLRFFDTVRKNDVLFEITRVKSPCDAPGRLVKQVRVMEINHAGGWALIARGDELAKRVGQTYFKRLCRPEENRTNQIISNDGMNGLKRAS